MAKYSRNGRRNINFTNTIHLEVNLRNLNTAYCYTVYESIYLGDNLNQQAISNSAVLFFLLSLSENVLHLIDEQSIHITFFLLTVWANRST